MVLYFFLLCGDLMTGLQWCWVVASGEMGSRCVLGGLGGGRWSPGWSLCLNLSKLVECQ